MLGREELRCLGLEAEIGEAVCPDSKMEMRDAETEVINQQRKKCSERPECGLEAAERLITAFSIHIQNLYVTWIFSCYFFPPREYFIV